MTENKIPSFEIGLSNGKKHYIRLEEHEYNKFTEEIENDNKKFINVGLRVYRKSIIDYIRPLN